MDPNTVSSHSFVQTLIPCVLHDYVQNFLISLPIFIDHNLPKVIADVWVSYLWQAGGVFMNVCGSPKLM